MVMQALGSHVMSSHCVTELGGGARLLCECLTLSVGLLCTEYLWCSCGLPGMSCKCAYFHMGTSASAELRQQREAILQAVARILFDDRMTGHADPCLPGVSMLRLAHSMFRVTRGQSVEVNYVDSSSQEETPSLSSGGLGLICIFAY